MITPSSSDKLVSAIPIRNPDPETKSTERSGSTYAFLKRAAREARTLNGVAGTDVNPLLANDYNSIFL